MKNELRARLQRANDLSESRRMGLRERLEHFLSEDHKPDGEGSRLVKVAKERDVIEHELELATEWAAATRALVDHLLSELLGDPVNEEYGSNFFNQGKQPGLQVAPDEMPRAKVR
jgi:hypothetical protein